MSRWRQLPNHHWEKIPPDCCPGCGSGWPQDGPWRPTEGALGCGCHGIGTRHTAWGCRICGALVAEGCDDVTRWGVAHIPAGLPAEARWGIPEQG